MLRCLKAVTNCMRSALTKDKMKNLPFAKEYKSARAKTLVVLAISTDVSDGEQLSARRKSFLNK